MFLVLLFQFCLALVVSILLDLAPGSWSESFGDRLAQIKTHWIKHIKIWLIVSVIWTILVGLLIYWSD